MAFAVALCAGASGAQAHAPLPQRVALMPDGTTTALALPGFGILFRSQPDQAFVYVCDALLGLRPRDLAAAMTFLADGSLLLSNTDGVRIVGADGCPLASSESDLGTAPVFASAVQPIQAGLSGAGQVAYAVVGGDKAGLWRSTDGGRQWELRAPIDDVERTHAVVVNAEDPSQVYLSVGGAIGSTLFASADGGATLTAFPQEPTFTLLHAETGTSGRLWAMARDAQTVGNRGFAILRAAGPAGPWQTMLRVNYFGGFVVDPHGVIWVGDEIGGVYRSDDGGDTFVNMESATDVSCLAYAGDALWACSPGTAAEPVLQKLVAGHAPFVEVVAFNDVVRLVACPGVDVEQVCAAAWQEWQRDVLARSTPSEDAGTSLVPGQFDAGQADAGPDVFTEPDAPRAQSACSVVAALNATSDVGNTRWSPVQWLVALCVLLSLRRMSASGRARHCV